MVDFGLVLFPVRMLMRMLRGIVGWLRDWAFDHEVGL